MLPTSHGKSGTYQLAATLLDGVTVVVSPLIPLHHDEVEQLEDIGFDDVVALSSWRRSAEIREAGSTSMGALPASPRE